MTGSQEPDNGVACQKMSACRRCRHPCTATSSIESWQRGQWDLREDVTSATGSNQCMRITSHQQRGLGQAVHYIFCKSTVLFLPSVRFTSHSNNYHLHTKSSYTAKPTFRLLLYKNFNKPIFIMSGLLGGNKKDEGATGVAKTGTGSTFSFNLPIFLAPAVDR